MNNAVIVVNATGLRLRHRLVTLRAVGLDPHG